MADFAAQSIVVCFVSWQAGPGEALLCAAMWGGLGQVECVLLYILIPVLPPPPLISSRTVVGTTGAGQPLLPKLSSSFSARERPDTAGYTTVFLLGKGVGG
jgi:hypothetical protein